MSIDPINHPRETESNALRARAADVTPKCQRTYTPSLAVLARSEGCYHWTPEGRKLADFTSGVLVVNLGHHPTRWWQRLAQYMGLPPGALAPPRQSDDGQTETTPPFFAAAPLTAYNAITELEVLASERLLDSVRGEPGGERMEHVLWAASGSEAIQKSSYCESHYYPPSLVLKDLSSSSLTRLSLSSFSLARSSSTRLASSAALAAM